jgi:hypothetical protein
MVNLKVKLVIDSELDFPVYVWVNDENEYTNEGYSLVDVSVTDDDYEVFESFLNKNKEDVISYEVY